VLCLAASLRFSFSKPVLHPSSTRRVGLRQCLVSSPTPRSQNTTILLPLPQVLLAINRSARLSVLPVLRNLLNALRDERRQLLQKPCQHFLPQLTSISLDPFSYVEARQIRTHVCAHFLVVDNVSSPLGVSAHSTGAVALVVVFAGLLGGERQAADGAEERGGGLHGGGDVRGLEVFLVFLFDAVVSLLLLLLLRRSGVSTSILECRRVARVM
jgi:hypothetical protein